jgi:Asp-tRNA(Asn)/Glu-tRNA(Gln) amidotransferase A subunit family amidase
MPNLSDVVTLHAIQARDRIARGELKAVEYAKACLGRIDEVEPRVHAWRCIDRNLVMGQAEAADAHRATGQPLGTLHGLTVGIKDIIDTSDLPTENGTTLDAGRRPRHDASVVSRLRAAGAVILGKTVTTELAFRGPGETRNPHDESRTPGGSSSGSAAAVAAGMVPLAVGTQTAGSIIRPASFCGVVGFKPSHGLLPRTGALTQSPHLDTLGAFGRCVEDVAMICDAMAGHDPRDPYTRIEAPPRLLELALCEPPLQPRIALVRQSAWDEAEDAMRQAFEEFGAEFRSGAKWIDLPKSFDESAAIHNDIMLPGFARYLSGYYARDPGALSPILREAIEEGQQVPAVRYLAALDWRDVMRPTLDEIFDHFDVIATPAATGEALIGLELTGSAAFNALWTLMGLPAVTLPLMTGPNGMPMGIQLVGRQGQDGRLLRTARWLMATLANVTGEAA